MIIVEDNGIGREKSEQIKKTKTIEYDSRSTEIIEERVQLLDQLNTSLVSVKTIDLFNSDGASGTRVEISIA